MKTSYDSSTDSLYIEVRPLPSKRTVEIEPDVMLDCGEDGELVGYDIQHASTKTDLIGRLVLVPAASQSPIRKMYAMPMDQSDFDSRFVNWLTLENASCDDVIAILDLLDSDDSNQALRRAFIRASWSYIESVTAGLHDLADFASKCEPENYPVIGARENACDRVKKVLNAGCKMMCPGWNPDFSGVEWVNFRKSNTKRGLLMHPKEVKHLYVSDDDLCVAKNAISWLIQTTNEIKRRASERAGSSLT